MMLVNSCRIQVGRLLEIRVDAGYNTVADVEQMIGWIRQEVARLPITTQLVIAADWRACRLMSTQASERALEMLSYQNPRVQRSAILSSSESPLAVLQFLRLVRESGHPNRRLFSDPTEMASWLCEVLNRSEQVRLAEFLVTKPVTPSTPA